MKSRGNCLLEAPTGFGKTACIFSAYLAFLVSYTEALQVITATRELMEGAITVSKSRLVLTLKNSLGFDQFKIERILAFIDETVPLCNIFKLENGALRVYDMNAELSAPKLIFCSRTHEQLKQAQKYLFDHFQNAPIVTHLCSRQHYCPNEDAVRQSQRSGISLNVICKSLIKNKKCVFDCNPQGGPVASVDMEDFHNMCKSQQKCPFHQAQNQVESAQIIFCPYNYIFDPGLMAQSTKKALVNAVLAIDEGHSIYDVCRQAFSLNFTQTDIDGALYNLRLGLKLAQERKVNSASLNTEKIDDYTKMINQIDLGLSMLKQIHSNLDYLNKNIVSVDKNTKIYQFLNVLDKILVNYLTSDLFDALEQVDNLIYAAKHDSGRQNYTKIYEKEINNAYFGKIQQILGLFKIYACSFSQTKNFNEFEIIRQVVEKEQNVVVQYNLICFTPKFSINSVLTCQPRMVLLTSGTLSPFNNIESQLDMQFRIKCSHGHFFNLAKQLKARIITKLNTTSQYQLIGTYQNRDTEYYTQISLVIAKITAKLPAEGILLFLNSYELLEKIKPYLSTQFARMQEHQTTETVYENPNALVEFKERVSYRKRTILVAVQRGKLSEGIDFSNELCRAVIVVSIPFPNKNETIIARTMDWLDKNSKYKGKDYFMQQTFQTVNQAVGRLIRNQDDYGAIYLLDQRYTDNLDRLPVWIRDVISHGAFEEEKDDNFFSNRSTRQQIVNTDEFIFDEYLQEPTTIVPTTKYSKELKPKQLYDAIVKFSLMSEPDKNEKIENVLTELKQMGLYDKFVSITRKPKILMGESLLQLVKLLRSDEQIIFLLGGCEQWLYDDVLARM